jgi:hypothetical protein
MYKIIIFKEKNIKHHYNIVAKIWTLDFVNTILRASFPTAKFCEFMYHGTVR